MILLAHVPASALARPLLCLGLVALFGGSGCVIPTSLERETQVNDPPVFVSADPPFGDLFPPATIDLRAVVADQNVDDTLTVRLFHGEMRSNGGAEQTIDGRINSKLERTFVFSSLNLCTFGDENLYLYVADHGFSQTEPFKPVPSDGGQSDFVIENHWTVHCK